MPLLTKITLSGSPLSASWRCSSARWCLVCPVCRMQGAEQLPWLAQCVISFEKGGNSQQHSDHQQVACLVPAFFFNFLYNCNHSGGKHQHQLLLSQDAFRCVTSDKQAIIRNSLLLDHQSVRKLSSILPLPAAPPRAHAHLWLLSGFISSGCQCWHLIIKPVALSWHWLQSLRSQASGTYHSNLICFLTPLSLKMFPCSE